MSKSRKSTELAVSADVRMNKILKVEQKLAEQKQVLMTELMSSNDAYDLIKANASFVDQKSDTDRKSFIVDPQEFQDQFGYKEKPVSMSYGMLNGMSKTPIINAIIRTRISQVATFTEPQRDQYSLGYKIQKKRRLGETESKMTKQEYKEIELIQTFIEDCGFNKQFHSDDFDTFVRKLTRDSMVYDQMTFEVARDRKGQPQEFWAVDASTIRIADSYDDKSYEEKGGVNRNKREQISGYYPSYVQIYQNQTINEFYPWEMCFGVRNPSTDINSNNYGVSELEEMAFVVTSMLWGDEYNKGFFKRGSAPKGMLRVSGNLSGKNLQSFRQEWNATMRGVYNSWKTPILESDKAEWIDLQKNNRDMEYSKWSEYLIKIGCAMYSIDPAEVNFPLQGGSEKTMFEGNNAARLQHSKDKGLYPLLRFFQKRFNKYLINDFFDGKYEMVFSGLDSMSPSEQQDMDIKAVSNIETLNEVRVRRGLKEIEGGDVVLNSVFMQKQQMDSQAAMFAQQGQEASAGGGGFVPDEEVQKSEESNPIMKSLQKYLDTL